MHLLRVFIESGVQTKKLEIVMLLAIRGALIPEGSENNYTIIFAANEGLQWPKPLPATTVETMPICISTHNTV